MEPHILAIESSRRQTLAAHTARREAYLRARDDEKERWKRDALRKIAPGFEPQGSPLVPTKKAAGVGQEIGMGQTGHQQSKNVMDNLVDQLAALNSKSF